MTRPPSRRTQRILGGIPFEELTITPRDTIRQWTPITYDEALSGNIPSKAEIKRRIAAHEAKK